MESRSKNHCFVNWVDGMKITKSHFQDTDNATIDLIAKSTAVTVDANRYGLLAVADYKHKPEDIVLSLDAQQTLKAQLNNCIAVSSQGHYIYITDAINATLGASGSFEKITTLVNLKDNDAEDFYIILAVNPYIKQPFGDANEEEPPRHPHVLPKYTLSVIDADSLNTAALGGTHLVIGKLKNENGIPALVTNYIPPSYSIQSHIDLVYIYSEMLVFFGSIERHALQIIQKIFQKKQTNELAYMVLSISQNVLQYVSGILPEFTLEDRNASPVKMITKLQGLGRIMKNSIDVYTGSGKEELVNYITSWSATTQGDFENVLANMVDVTYIHHDVNLSLATVSKFSKIMLSLFKKLDDLDYIGKKSDSNIFVKEEVVAKQDVKQRRSFLLD